MRHVRKKYQLLEMEDDIEPAKVAKAEKPEKKSRRLKESRHREHGREEESTYDSLMAAQVDRPEKSSRRPKEVGGRHRDGYQEDRSRTKDDERHKQKSLRRKGNDDFDDRWGDEEYVEEAEFAESPAKRRRLSNGSATSLASEDDLDEDAKRERAMERDQKESLAFAERLKKKDAENTKKIVEDRSSTKEGKEVARRRALAEDAMAREAAMPDLRERSRQEYLKKREAEQIVLLRKQVASETEELRKGEPLTRREKAEFEKNRELLKLAEARLNIDDHRDGYMMPEDYITEKGKLDRQKKQDALYKRYVDRDEHGQERFVTEQEEWEREQTAKVKAQIAQ
ncbi:MAG: hypothetical protein Q9183_007248, partial [Haloplaca sp. 2 TL-2023]